MLLFRDKPKQWGDVRCFKKNSFICKGQLTWGTNLKLKEIQAEEEANNALVIILTIVVCIVIIGIIVSIVLLTNNFCIKRSNKITNKNTNKSHKGDKDDKE